jgi:HK97 family phage prohead protease
MLSQHGGTDFTDKTPIGIWIGLDQDDRGLKLKGKLAINTTRGANAYALLKMKPRPAYNGLSIGYRATDYELHKSGPIKRTLKSVDLVEISLVTFPADKFARVASVKACLEDEPVVDDAAVFKEMARRDWQRISRLAMLNGR